MTVNTKDNIVLYSIVGILIWCLIQTSFFYQEKNDKSNHIPISLIDSSVKERTLSSGKKVYSNESSILTKEEVKLLLSQNKELKEQLGGLKNFISKINTKIDFNQQTVILPGRVDTITKTISSDYEDSCITAVLKTDSMSNHHLSYKIKPLDIQLLTRYEKTGFLKPKKTVLDISIQSGCGRSVSQKQVIINPKVNRLSIQGQVGYGITLHGLSPYAGVGVGIRF